MKIVTEIVFPPIPIRNFDWRAYDDDTYDGDTRHSPVGYGATKEEAIEDFKGQLVEKEEDIVTCSKCGSPNVTTEQHQYYSGVWHAGVGEQLWAAIATCADCGQVEEL